MANKPKLSGLIKRTEPGGPGQQAGDNADLDEGRIVAAGVGIREGELEAIKALAEEHGVKPNALMRLAIRLFINGVRAGQISIEDYLEAPPTPAKRVKFTK